jgi:hypothetical protein
MTGELDERQVFLADVMENANRARVLAEDSDDEPSGATELPLQRFHALNRRLEVLFIKSFENIHDEGILPQVRGDRVVNRVKFDCADCLSVARVGDFAAIHGMLHAKY